MFAATEGKLRETTVTEGRSEFLCNDSRQRRELLILCMCLPNELPFW